MHFINKAKKSNLLLKSESQCQMSMHESDYEWRITQSQILWMHEDQQHLTKHEYDSQLVFGLKIKKKVSINYTHSYVKSLSL